MFVLVQETGRVLSWGRDGPDRPQIGYLCAALDGDLTVARQGDPLSGELWDLGPSGDESFDIAEASAEQEEVESTSKTEDEHQDGGGDEEGNGVAADSDGDGKRQAAAAAIDASAAAPLTAPLDAAEMIREMSGRDEASETGTPPLHPPAQAPSIGVPLPRPPPVEVQRSADQPLATVVPPMLLDIDYVSKAKQRRDYTDMTKIGEGTFGVVWRAIEAATGDVVAIKMLKKTGQQQRFSDVADITGGLHFTVDGTSAMVTPRAQLASPLSPHRSIAPPSPGGYSLPQSPAQSRGLSQPRPQADASPMSLGGMASNQTPRSEVRGVGILYSRTPLTPHLYSRTSRASLSAVGDAGKQPARGGARRLSRYIRAEIECCRHLQHPNLVRARALFWNDSGVFLVMSMVSHVFSVACRSFH
jgi:hypothetical protein